MSSKPIGASIPAANISREALYKLESGSASVSDSVKYLPGTTVYIKSANQFNEGVEVSKQIPHPEEARKIGHAFNQCMKQLRAVSRSSAVH